MIELKNICKTFGKHEVLKDFSLQIKKNEFVAIIGESGAGKTTILNIISMLEQPDAGEIVINENNHFTKKEIQNLRRYVFGYIFQNYVLIEEETVKENLLISKKYRKNFKEQELEENILMTVNDFNVQQDLIISAEEALSLANTVYETTKQRFMIGKADINSLTLSLNRQTSARNNYINALKQYWISYYNQSFLKRLPVYRLREQVIWKKKKHINIKQQM